MKEAVIDMAKIIESGAGRKPYHNSSQETISRYNKNVMDEAAMFGQSLPGALAYLKSCKNSTNQQHTKK